MPFPLKFSSCDRFHKENPLSITIPELCWGLAGPWDDPSTVRGISIGLNPPPAWLPHNINPHKGPNAQPSHSFNPVFFI
jgi:hypothetical protein